MKKSVNLTILLLCAIAGLALGAVPTLITLAWDYTVSDITPDMIFKIYHSTDVAATNWPLMTNVSPPALSVQLTILPGAHFFYATASNFWGESDPSNIAKTPGTARNPTNLTIRRGP